MAPIRGHETPLPEVDMGDIVRLPPREERKPGDRAEVAPAAQSATILLFMGVRYERHDGSAGLPAKSPSKPRAKKRA